MKHLLKSIATFVVVLSLPWAAMAETWLTQDSQASVDETEVKLVQTIEAAGATVFARIDHKAAAAAAGLEMQAAKVVIFGNPKLGTPIMVADPMAAIDLPIRILIWDDEGTVKLRALSGQGLAERYELEAAAPQLQQMDAALNRLMSEASE